MDAAAYLTSQGWLGEGHALHHSGRGITKPIIASKKSNVFGIGKKKHDAHADQWWARAFDDTLKGLNTTRDKSTGKTQGISLGANSQGLRIVGCAGKKWAGQGSLYSNFVRGESLSGTLTPEGDESGRTEDEGQLTLAKPRDRKKRNKERPSRDKAASSLGEAISDGVIQVAMNSRDDLREGETKEERRQRRKERRARKALRSGRSD